MRGYPRYFNALLSASLLLLLFSGLVLMPSFLEMRLRMSVPWRPDFAPRTGVALLHTGGGMLLVWVLGALWAVHVRAGWRRRLNRLSGALLVTVLSGLMLSSLGILYAGDEMWSLTASVLHVLAGLLLPVLVLVHALPGRRRRQPPRDRVAGGSSWRRAA